MPARIQIACEEAQPWQGITCGYIDVEVPADSAPDITAATSSAGWTRDEKGYHCPRHDPASRWLRVRLSTDSDIEPLPGLRIRLRPDATTQPPTRLVVDAELLLDPARYDIEEVGRTGLGRAKPVGTDWPDTEASAR